MIKYLLCCLIILYTVGCKSARLPEVKPFEVAAPDSLPDPQPANGWEFRRTSATHGVFLPPVVPAKVKYKNLGNTDNSQHKSNNTKDKSVVKDKAKTKAKEGAAIGEGNSVKQEKGVPPWVFVGGVLLLLVLFFRKYLFKSRST